MGKCPQYPVLLCRVKLIHKRNGETRKELGDRGVLCPQFADVEGGVREVTCLMLGAQRAVRWPQSGLQSRDTWFSFLASLLQEEVGLLSCVLLAAELWKTFTPKGFSENENAHKVSMYQNRCFLHFTLVSANGVFTSVCQSFTKRNEKSWQEKCSAFWEGWVSGSVGELTSTVSSCVLWRGGAAWPPAPSPLIP